MSAGVTRPLAALAATVAASAGGALVAAAIFAPSLAGSGRRRGIVIEVAGFVLVLAGGFLAGTLTRGGEAPDADTAAPVAVIFESVRPPPAAEDDGYAGTAARMEELAHRQPGFLGVVSARSPDTRLGITVSYWRSEADVLAWKQNAEHAEARRQGRRRWYQRYRVVVARVLRDYGSDSPGTA